MLSAEVIVVAVLGRLRRRREGRIGRRRRVVGGLFWLLDGGYGGLWRIVSDQGTQGDADCGCAEDGREGESIATAYLAWTRLSS